MDLKFKIKTAIQPAAGKLLIAEPLMPDPHFQRGVVYLCNHNNDGSYGFVLNKPIDKTLDYFIEDLDKAVPLFLGGPVETSSIHFLHRMGNELGGEVTENNIYFGGDFQKAVSMIQDGRLQAKDIKFFLGYAGWSQQQLDEEIQKNSWLVSDTNQLMIFSSKTDRLWEQSILSLDKEFHQLVNLPIDPSLN